MYMLIYAALQCVPALITELLFSDPSAVMTHLKT